MAEYTREQLVENFKKVYEWAVARWKQFEEDPSKDGWADKQYSPMQELALIVEGLSSYPDIKKFLKDLIDVHKHLAQHEEDFSSFGEKALRYQFTAMDFTSPKTLGLYGSTGRIFFSDHVELTDEMVAYLFAASVGGYLTIGGLPYPDKFGYQLTSMHSVEATANLFLKTMGRKSIIPIFRALVFPNDLYYTYELIERYGVEEMLTEHIDWRNAGVSWSYSLKGVTEYLCNANSEKFGEENVYEAFTDGYGMILKASVHAEDVDWLASVWLASQFWQEQELRLKQETPLVIEKIFFGPGHFGNLQSATCKNPEDCIVIVGQYS